MKNSRISLNKPFYDWIKEVRDANKKIEELEDKLYFYNVKLIGYNSPNFEPRLSSTKPEYKDNRYIWLSKIDKVEVEIMNFKKLINNFRKFETRLTEIEKNVLKEYMYTEIKELVIPRSYRYLLLNKISRKYLQEKLIL